MTRWVMTLLAILALSLGGAHAVAMATAALSVVDEAASGLPCHSEQDAETGAHQQKAVADCCADGCAGGCTMVAAFWAAGLNEAGTPPSGSGLAFYAGLPPNALTNGLKRPPRPIL